MTYRALMCLAIFISCTLMSQQVRAEARVGVNAAVQGDVFVVGVKKKIERRAKVRENVFIGDAITTKRNSALQVLLIDETIFTVGQNCRLVIDRFVYDSQTQASQVAASVTRGAFRFMTGKIGKKTPSTISLKTPASTIGIRGTIAEGAVGRRAINIASAAGVDARGADARTATLMVLRGPGRARNSFDRVGRITVTGGNTSVNINRPGWAVLVPRRGAAPIGPFKMNRQAFSYLDVRLRSRPRGKAVRPLDVQKGGGALSKQDKFNEPYVPSDPKFRDRQDYIDDLRSNDFPQPQAPTPAATPTPTPTPAPTPTPTPTPTTPPPTVNVPPATVGVPVSPTCNPNNPNC